MHDDFFIARIDLIMQLVRNYLEYLSITINRSTTTSQVHVDKLKAFVCLRAYFFFKKNLVYILINVTIKIEVFALYGTIHFTTFSLKEKDNGLLVISLFP